MGRGGEGKNRGQGKVKKEMRRYFGAIMERGILTTQRSGSHTHSEQKLSCLLLTGKR